MIKKPLHMIISVLTENNAGPQTPSEHGLSYIIEYDDEKILFDTGQSDMFVQNARIMGITVNDVDLIVLSHGHYDHGNGLSYIHDKKLICHNDCFVKRYRKSDLKSIGLKNSKEEISKKFDLICTKEAYKISDKIIFLGEIPRLTDFESQQTDFIFQDGSPDFVMDDSAISMITNEGLFVITGCGHAGVVNTLEHAKKLCGESRICGIMGGFHLKEANKQTMETVRYLKNQKVKYIYPSHCTALPALNVFYDNFKINTLKTGDIITI